MDIERVTHCAFQNSLQLRMFVTRPHVGNDQEMAQSERNSKSTNRGGGGTKMTLRYLYQENTQLPELNYKYENVHKVQTAQNSTPKHKTIRTTTEVLPSNDQ